MINRNKKFFLVSILTFYFGSLSTLYSQEITGKLKGLWGTISQESADVLEQTVESIQTITSDVGDAINSQLVALVAEKSSDDGLEIQDKIDTIKLYVKKINSLKKEEQKASSFTLVRKSKKDYRIKIDKVLREIEPLLFEFVIFCSIAILLFKSSASKNPDVSIPRA